MTGESEQNRDDGSMESIVEYLSQMEYCSANCRPSVDNFAGVLELFCPQSCRLKTLPVPGTCWFRTKISCLATSALEFCDIPYEAFIIPTPDLFA
jgi:hypothetical protein